MSKKKTKEPRQLSVYTQPGDIPKFKRAARWRERSTNDWVVRTLRREAEAALAEMRGDA